MATLPGMAERTITISGISKSCSVTGWRIGWAIAAPELSDGIRRAHDFVTVGAPHPRRDAAVSALTLPDSYYVVERDMYQAKRRIADDTAFAMFLIKEVGVATVPGVVVLRARRAGAHEDLLRFPEDGRRARRRRAEVTAAAPMTIVSGRIAVLASCPP